MEQIGRYQGSEVYRLSFEEYILIDENTKNIDPSMYVINEDDMVILKGKIVARLINGKTIDPVNSIRYETYYASKLAARKEKAEKVKVVTTRTTVEKLAIEGSKKLESLVAEGSQKTFNIVSKKPKE